MKIKNIACIASILAASLSGAKAATTLTAWNFDNVAIGASSSPSPSTGFGTASAVGLGASSNPDVQSLAGSSTGLANSWRVRGAGGGGIGWSTNAAIGAQGAQFTASTLGYYKIKVSFDVYATINAEAALLVQYTTDGAIWNNATITSAGIMGHIATNTNPTNNLVVGSYVVLTNNGTAGWNNGVTVDLAGVSGVDNDPKFAIRIVNASTGTNCFTTTGAHYDNTSGDWTFDNVVVQGQAIDTIADWTFESYGTDGFVPHPVPDFNVSSFAYATALGFDNTYTYSDGTSHSTNAPDTLVQGGSSTPTGTICWRVRGAGPSNGWNSQAPVGTQGAEFDVSTVNYNNVVLSFDLYFTTQGEAKMCVLYTTDGWATTNVANKLFYGANPTYIHTNSVSDPDYTPENAPLTVQGTFFYETYGQNWFNNLVVDFTGVPGVDNNPNFGVRIVNAASGAACVNFTGGSYNNSSGNCRFDNVSIGGTFNGSTPPVLSYDPNATVDAPFTNTFTDDAAWRSQISAIYVNGSLLSRTVFTTNQPGKIVFNPTNSVLLQSAGVKSIVIYAANYSSDKVTQPLSAGVATKLAVTMQPAAPSASGGTLTANPVLAIVDKYGNGTTNPYSNVTVTAAANSAKWVLGGDTVQTAVDGIMTFTNLSATATNSAGSVSNYLTFTISGYAPLSTTNSAQFTIGPAPVPFTPGNLAVLQIDNVANNSTISILELKPSAAGQTTPVNIVPISAAGTNALRLASAGACGKLTLSDDGTLVSFVGFADGSAATPDETFVLNRAVGTLNYTNLFNIGSTYTSISLGGSEGRSCCTLDNYNWIVDDKGGLYYGNSAINPLVNFYVANNVVVRTFGGVPYVETQKTLNGSPVPVVFALDPVTRATQPNNLGVDQYAADFYLISTNGGTTYDVMYLLDQVSSSQGIIRKYSWVAGADVNNPNGQYGWAVSGSFTNTIGVDNLFATTNGAGGVYLFYTTGAGGTAGNSIIRVTDANGWNQNINITSSNAIYKASSTASLKGLTFVPRQSAATAWLIPPPILTAQTFAATNSSFTVTNTPDDPLWRASITGVMVNGSLLSAAAYTTNQSGKIVFDPAQDPLLQIPGVKTIVFSAAGYSTNTIAQTISGAAAKLAVKTQPKAPAADGGPLATQPVVAVQDAFGNAVASTANIVAAVGGSGTWTLGGTTTKAAVSGTATFSNLNAFSPGAVAGATISFTSSGLTGVTSASFNIPAPVMANLGGVWLTGGKFKVSFTNAPGLSFSVLATNDLTAPRAIWPVVGQVVESPAGSGNYQYTNSVPTNAQQYFIIRQP